MKTIHFFTLFVLILFVSCNSTSFESKEQLFGNSVIVGKIDGYHPKLCPSIIQLIVPDILKDEGERYITKIDSMGNFVINFQVDYPQETIILFAKSSIYLLSFPDDTTHVDMTVGNLDGYVPNVELIESKSKNLKFGEFTNNINQFSGKLSVKYETGKYIQGDFEYYYELVNKIKAEQLRFLDSIKSNRDLDSILVKWAEERIRYEFMDHIINYYTINSMLNRSASKKDVFAEGLLERPIDINFQSTCDSILKNAEIDSFVNRTSAYYSYFLNSLSAYNSFQFSSKSKDEYWQNFPKYLFENYSGDEYELLFTRFLFTHLNQIELKRNIESLAEIKKEFPDLLGSLKNEKYRSFLEEELLRIDNIIKSDKPKALKHNLANYPDTDNFWKKVLLKHNNDKVLYVKFWAPWCGPCMGNWKSAQSLVQKYSNEKFELINLCIGTKENQWSETITKHKIVGIHYLLSEDQSSVLKASLNIQGIPYNLLIDKKGEIRYFDAITTGSADGSINKALVMQIDDLLNE